jgi:hypothetical protein
MGLDWRFDPVEALDRREERLYDALFRPP